MIHQALVLVLLLPLVACGWNKQCTKPTSYNLGEEKIAVVGSEMVQVGCFAIRYDPTGLNRSLWNRSSYDDLSDPRIEKELLYAGRVGDILHITYREYYSRMTPEGSAGSYARPAFFQQVYYDLKTSDAIVFQNWVLQVLDANNQQIRFKVVKEAPLIP